MGVDDSALLLLGRLLLDLGLGADAEELSEHVHTLAGQARDLEDRAHLTMGNCVLDLINIFVALDNLGNLLAMSLQDLADLVKIRPEDILWCQIDLGEDDEDRDLEGVGNTDVLLGHLGDAHVGSDDQNAVVWIGARQAMHRGLQVLLVAAQIGEVDDLGGVLHDIWPDLVLLVRMSDLGNILLSVSLETHDLVGNRAGPSIVFFVYVVEDVLPHKASAVIDGAGGRGQDADKGRLTGIYITKH